MCVTFLSAPCASLPLIHYFLLARPQEMKFMIITGQLLDVFSSIADIR